MNIEKFREQFPQYNNWSDNDLAKSLHDKFYKGMKYEDFAKQFLVSTPPKEKGLTSQFERIKDIYLQEVSEGGKAVTKMVEKPSGKAILSGISGALRWGFAPLTAAGEAFRKPVEETQKLFPVPKGWEDTLWYQKYAPEVAAQIPVIFPYGRMVKGAIGVLETKEAMKAGELLAKDAAKVQAAKEAREIAAKPPLKYPSEPTAELAAEMAATGKLSKPVIEESLQKEVATVTSQLLKQNPDEKRRIGQQVIDLIHSNQMDWSALPNVLSKYGITPQEFAQRLKDTYSTAGRTLARLSIVARKMQQTFKDNPQASKYLDEIAKIAPEQTFADRAFNLLYNMESTRRGFLVTQLATTMRNALSQAGRATIGSIDDAFQGAIRATVGGQGNVLKQIGDGLDIWAGFYKRLSPVARKRLDNILASDGADIAKIKLLSTPVHEVTLGNKAATVLNIPNRAQELFFRKIAFESKLSQLLDRVGMDVKNIDPNKIPSGMLEQAAEYALEMTFAAMPKSKAAQSFVRTMAGQPLFTALINPFPRFAFGNALPFMVNFSPISFMKALNPKIVAELATGSPEQFAKLASRATIGSMMLGLAVSYRNGPEASEKYYEFASGDKRYDLRSYAPLLTPYLLVAEAMIRPERLKAADWIQAAIGLNRVAGTGLVATDLIRSEKAEAAQNIISRLAGEYLGSFSVPVRTFKDLYSIINDKEQVIRDTRDNPLTAPFIKNLPHLSQTLPESVSPLKTVAPGIEPPIDVAGVKIPVPVFRQFTGISRKTLTAMEKEVAKLDIKNRTIYPNTGIPEADRKIAGYMGKDIEIIASKILNSPKYQKLDEKVKKIIWEGAMGYDGVFAMLKKEALKKLQAKEPKWWTEIWLKRKSELSKDILGEAGITKERINEMIK